MDDIYEFICRSLDNNIDDFVFDANSIEELGNIVYAPDKSSGHRQQKVKIFWNFLDEIDIPDIEGTVVYQRPLKTQKTA